MNKIEIEHPYLRFFLLGEKADSLPSELCGSHGWVYQGHTKLGRVFLTYLVYIAFKIHRLPNHYEQFYKCDTSELYDFFYKISLEVIDDCVKELILIYNHTQDEIKNNAELNIISNKILLKRGLRGDLARALKICAKRAIENNEKVVTYPVNTISSYAYGSGFVSNGASIEEWVSLEDVLLCNKTVQNWPEDEFLILNKHPRGLAELDISECQIEAPDATDYEKYTKNATISQALEFVYAYHNFQWTIDRNFPFREPNIFERAGRWLDSKVFGEKFTYQD